MSAASVDSSDSAASKVGVETWLMESWDIFATGAFMALEGPGAGLCLNPGTYANSSAGRDNPGMAEFLPAHGYEQLTCAV
jgi:hypothetical protein